MLKLILSMLAKWVFLIVVFVVCFKVLGLPALALLAGVIAALTFQALALARP